MPVREKISVVLSTMAVLAMVAGSAVGVAEYRARAGDLVVHDPSTNAVAVHIVLGAVLIAAVGIYWWRHESRPDLLAPIRSRAATRIRATIRSATHGVAGIGRTGVVILLGVLLLYLLFRMGMQITAGFAPAFVTNAWGGPSAAGAFLAHGLDALLVGLLCLAVLDRVMLRRPDHR